MHFIKTYRSQIRIRVVRNGYRSWFQPGERIPEWRYRLVRAAKGSTGRRSTISRGHTEKRSGHIHRWLPEGLRRLSRSVQIVLCRRRGRHQLIDDVIEDAFTCCNCWQSTVAKAAEEHQPNDCRTVCVSQGHGYAARWEPVPGVLTSALYWWIHDGFLCHWLVFLFSAVKEDTEESRFRLTYRVAENLCRWLPSRRIYNGNRSPIAKWLTLSYNIGQEV